LARQEVVVLEEIEYFTRDWATQEWVPKHTIHRMEYTHTRSMVESHTEPPYKHCPPAPPCLHGAFFLLVCCLHVIRDAVHELCIDVSKHPRRTVVPLIDSTWPDMLIGVKAEGNGRQLVCLFIIRLFESK
jgi:hypothetical protein